MNDTKNNMNRIPLPKSFTASPTRTRSSISKSLRSSPLFVPAFCRGLWLPLPARRPAPREVGGWTRRGATRKEGPHVLALQPGHRRRRLWCTSLFFLLPLHRRRRPQQPPASPRRLHVYCSIHGGCPILGGGCATCLSHGYHEPDEEPMRPGRKTERATQTICAGPVEAFARGPGVRRWRDRGTGYKRRLPPRIGTHLSLTPKTPDKVSTCISPTPSLLSLWLCCERGLH